MRLHLQEEPWGVYAAVAYTAITATAFPALNVGDLIAILSSSSSPGPSSLPREAFRASRRETAARPPLNGTRAAHSPSGRRQLEEIPCHPNSPRAPPGAQRTRPYVSRTATVMASLEARKQLPQ